MSSNQPELKKEEECKAEFKPVIDLSNAPEYKPEDIEEKEDIFFEMRVKALRFDSEANEWKERGVGSLKILRQKENQSKFRVLMRREKVFKICLNHAILSDMSLAKNVGSTKTWVYHTPADVSDGEAKAENVAIMFKNEEAADEFKKKFDEAVEIVKKASGDNKDEEKKDEEKKETSEEKKD